MVQEDSFIDCPWGTLIIFTEPSLLKIRIDLLHGSFEKDSHVIDSRYYLPSVRHVPSDQFRFSRVRYMEFYSKESSPFASEVGDLGLLLTQVKRQLFL